MKQVFILLILFFISVTPLLSQDNQHMDIRSAFSGNAFVETDLISPGDSCTVTNPERHDGFSHANGYTLFYDSSRLVILFHPQLYPWGYTKICVGLTSIIIASSFNYYIVMYDSASNGYPGNLLYCSPVQTATNVPAYPHLAWYSSLINLPLVPSAMRSAYIGIRYDNSPATNVYISVDESTATPLWPGYYCNSPTFPLVWQTFTSVPAYSAYKCLAIRTEGVQVIGIEKEGTEIPAGYVLKQNYPNPFNPSTRISFAVPTAEFIRLAVYDIAGREVAVLANENVSAGYYHVNFDAYAYTSGVYFYRLVSGSYSDVKKMVLLK